MENKDKIQLIGIVEHKIWDKSGKLKIHRIDKNLITNTGLAGAASRINGAGAEAAFHLFGGGNRHYGGERGGYRAGVGDY